jgi:glycosyltransferase involved in cell wall biosynthesis
MCISVVIPVYNAEAYLERAVESALRQDECAEVLLIEDRSPDNALALCQKLAAAHDRVALYTHPNNANRGPGPSRNLGIEKARHPLVAFLDADDFYLPGRFVTAVEIMSQQPEIDGVYEPVDSSFESAAAEQRFLVAHSEPVAMVTGTAAPDHLFDALISGQKGYIHPNGLVVRKHAALSVGGFPSLRLHEDTVFIFKLALVHKLVPGSIDKPVSTRLLHMSNTITRPGIDFLDSRHLAYSDLLAWIKKTRVGKDRQRKVEARFYRNRYRQMKKDGLWLRAIAVYLCYHLVFKKYASWERK